VKTDKNERVCIVLSASLLAEIDKLPLPRSTTCELLLRYAVEAHFIPDMEEAKVFSDERPAQQAFKEEISKLKPKPARKPKEVKAEADLFAGIL